MSNSVYGLGGVSPSKDKPGRKRYAMLVDLERCTGCNSCTAACKAAYDVPLGEWRMWVMEAETGEFPQTHRHVLPRFCNHCDDPPCVRSCPTQSTFKHPDGFVLQRYNRCIGCRACMVACPYNARFLLPEWRRDGRNPRNVADKCDFCVVRVTRGLAPICVASCTGAALIFGDINNPDSEIAQVVRTSHTFTLREELGTAPQVYYKGLGEDIANPEFTFHNRSAQLHERYNTFKRNSEVGAEMAGNIDDEDMGLPGLIRQGLRNFAAFFAQAPHKFFRGLY